MLMASLAIPAMMVAANTLPDFPVEDILVGAAVTPAAAAATAKDNSQGQQQGPLLERALFVASLMRGRSHGIVEAGKERFVIVAALGEAQWLDSLHAYLGRIR